MRVMWIVEAETFSEELEASRALGVYVKSWFATTPVKVTARSR